MVTGTNPESFNTSGRIRDVRYHSTALQRPSAYTAVLPASLSSAVPAHAETGANETPVVIVLHGAGRNRRTLIEDQTTRRLLLQAPFATVMPDGDLGWWVDASPEKGGGRYATLAIEVLRDAERRFGIGGSRERRAVAGWSMGGFGAVRFAEDHPDEVCAVVCIIGLLDFPNPAYPPEWNHAVPGFLAQYPKRYNPLSRVEQLRGLRILLVAADQAFDFRMNQRFHSRLAASGIAHRYVVIPGAGHTFPTVRRGLRIAVEFLRTVFQQSKGSVR